MKNFELISCDNCGKDFAVEQKEIEKDVQQSIQQNKEHPLIETADNVVHLSESHLICPYCWNTETLFKMGKNFTAEAKNL